VIHLKIIILLNSKDENSTHFVYVFDIFLLLVFISNLDFYFDLINLSRHLLLTPNSKLNYCLFLSFFFFLFFSFFFFFFAPSFSPKFNNYYYPLFCTLNSTIYPSFLFFFINNIQTEDLIIITDLGCVLFRKKKKSTKTKTTIQKK
jgi:hypothetical protein